MRHLLANVFAIDLARGMARVALSWLMLQRHGAAGLSAVVLAMSVGQFLGSLLAGYVTDRGDRRTLARESSWICGVGFALVGILLGSGSDSAITVCALVLLIYALLSVHDNAARTLIPSIVPRDGIERANGHFITAGEVGSFVGPMITGWLIGAYRADAVIVMAAGGCLIAALAINGLGHAARQRHTPEATLPAPGRLTIGYLRANGWLVFGLLLAVLANILLVPISLVLVPLRIKEVGFGAVELGYFYAALSAGFAAAGLLKLGDLWGRLGDARLAAFLAAGSAVYTLTFFFHILPVILLCGLGAGFFLARFEIGWSSLIQDRTRADMLGRVYGLGSWTSFAGRMIGVSGAGLLVAGAGVQVVTFALIMALLVTVVVLVAVTQTRAALIE